MSSLMILIAGPYRSGTRNDPEAIAANLTRLEEASWPLFRAGHVPMIGEWVALPVMRSAATDPRTSLGAEELAERVLYPTARRLLDRCDGVLRLPGESTGADQDVAIARDRGLPVWFRLEDVPGLPDMTPPIDARGTRVNLLGRPSVDGRCGGYQMRGRKSWALLAYLVLAERPPTRSRIAGLLFEEADDPLAALRWSLAEIRRGLHGVATLHGDPVALVRVPELVVDVDVVTRGPWTSAVRLPGLGSDLLEGLTIRGAVVFESWLLAEQRRLAAATAHHLEAAGEAMVARGDHRAAIGYAVRRMALAPLDEAAHVDLIRLYRAVGDHAAAAQHYDRYERLLAAETGTRPGTSVVTALRPSAEPAA